MPTQSYIFRKIWGLTPRFFLYQKWAWRQQRNSPLSSRKRRSGDLVGSRQGGATDPVVIPPNLSPSTPLVDPTSTNPNFSTLSVVQAANANLTYSRAQYVDARAAIRNSNNTSGDAIAKTLEVGGWRDPPGIPPKLLRAISSLHDNIPQATAYSRKTRGSGSGIPHSERPFQYVYADVVGKWAADISGSTYKMFLCEGKALYSDIIPPYSSHGCGNVVSMDSKAQVGGING